MLRLPIPLEQLKNRLVSEQLIAPERFDALANDAERKNQSLLEVLVSENIASAIYLNRFVAEFLGVEIVNLRAHALDSTILHLLDEHIAREREVIVFDREADGTLDIAMLDPSDLETIKFLTQHLGVRIHPFLATKDDLNLGFSVYGSELTSGFKESIEKNIQESLRNQGVSVGEAAAQVPIVTVVDNVLSYAISLRASDVHIEILEEETLIRYRIDGILYEILRIPKEVHNAIVARVKLLSGLQIDEHYQPQDGRFRYQIASQIIDIRVSVMPTYYGEKIVMRLLESSQKPLSLEELGILPEHAKLVVGNLEKTYGMILLCGPTGSGKTTTLYALMNILNKPNVNIVTVEDPIEYNMRYVNQTQVNSKAGITFASGLRAILRQDPNIIMVGEIRDKETVGIAVEAALTGHLVLSSLHTNDAPTAIPRIFDLEVPPFLAVSTLNLVIAQRLVRKICQACIYSYDSTPEIVKTIREELVQIGAPKNTPIPKLLYRGRGCSVCGDIGYRGRFGIFEMLPITESVKQTIAAPTFELGALRAAARHDGMISMFEDGLKKVELGLTAIEEVLRVIKE